MSNTLVTLAVVLVLGTAACGNKTLSEKTKSAEQAVGAAAKATGNAVEDATKK